MSTRDSILNLLISHKDSYISGEEIAGSLGLSRNAIWKAINELRKSGYTIEATRNKGYMFSSNNDILSSQEICSFLSAGLTPEIYVYPSIESTNRTAKEMAIAGATHGTTIIASKQSNGKAHNNESFDSPDGGLYMSIILDPLKLPFDGNTLISPFSAVCVCQAIEEIANISPSINLITDIFFEDKKIAGILNESAFDFETGNLQWIVIGIGIPEKITATRNQLVAAIINNILNSSITKDEILSYYKSHHMES